LNIYRLVSRTECVFVYAISPSLLATIFIKCDSLSAIRSTTAERKQCGSLDVSANISTSMRNGAALLPCSSWILETGFRHRRFECFTTPAIMAIIDTVQDFSRQLSIWDRERTVGDIGAVIHPGKNVLKAWTFWRLDR